jgi:two-component system, response regulator PdtaR
MSTETGIPPVPLHDAPSGPFDPPDALLASDDGAGSATRVHEADRILIVEDDLLIAAQIESALSEAGFEVIGVATTGEEAIDVAGQQTPDLAVVDIRLAGDRNGVDTALELFRRHGIRCIFASAYSDSEARQRAEPAAPLGWLQKPYSMTALIRMVRAAAAEMRGKRRR